MIGRTHAKKEIMRLSSAKYFPKHSQGVSELVDSLQLGAKSAEHATLVISEAVSKSKECPTPADIRTLCSDVGSKADHYPPPCDECRPQGGNWRLVTVHLPAGRGMPARTVEATTRCECPRGQLLAAREDEERRRIA